MSRRASGAPPAVTAAAGRVHRPGSRRTCRHLRRCQPRRQVVHVLQLLRRCGFGWRVDRRAERVAQYRRGQQRRRSGRERDPEVTGQLMLRPGRRRQPRAPPRRRFTPVRVGHLSTLSGISSHWREASSSQVCPVRGEPVQPGSAARRRGSRRRGCRRTKRLRLRCWRSAPYAQSAASMSRGVGSAKPAPTPAPNGTSSS